MEINYKTVATTTIPVILKGINVNFSAEYENNIPGIVTFSCDGHFVDENSRRSDYLNFSGSYDCENRHQWWSGVTRFLDVAGATDHGVLQHDQGKVIKKGGNFFHHGTCSLHN